MSATIYLFPYMKEPFIDVARYWWGLNYKLKYNRHNRLVLVRQ